MIRVHAFTVTVILKPFRNRGYNNDETGIDDCMNCISTKRCYSKQSEELLNLYDILSTLRYWTTS
jgi:hypothetical protein